ncbi:hypothetical protein [Enhygromyxa salina]|uniref:Caspase domain protein n=1 Tax=Enhygromyxa salina TaxID=215803 RepID=A0A2S9XNK6_9BACT|nr:hypothetical protein [Enhygromyxa salina]PRP94310.1 hypothetical protein ENSA7_78470 [Enhygromyxa salina]
MRRALLVGVADDHPKQQFRPGPSLDAIERLLEDLGGWTISRIEGARADRTTILAGLVELEAALKREDSALFYFAGHGGIVEIGDLPPPLGGRPVVYLATVRPGTQWRLEGVLDIELSLALARMDLVCTNVCAILDCCYSARMVRGPVTRLPHAPAWLRDLAAVLPEPGSCDLLLHPTSHPNIVRLAASSSLRTSFPDRVDGGHLGRLTRLFTEVVREADLQTERITWDAVAHRVREQAIWRLGCEEQWVSLAGPRQRLLFSRAEAPLPRSVGFVPREHGEGGWIRAGALQGVRVGDEWGLADLTLDDDLRPRWRARMRVTAVDLDRATLEPCDGGADFSPPPGVSALLLSAAERELVGVDGPAELREAVERSVRLVSVDDAAPPGSLTVLSSRGAAVEVRGGARSALFPADASGLASAVERMEAWAHARTLIAVAHSKAGSRPPFSLQVDRVLGRGVRPQRLDRSAVVRLHVGDRLRFTIQAGPTPGSWFVTVILIDVAGCPTLLDAAEPDGREILAGDRVTLGVHPHRDQQGIELRWPAGVAADHSRPATVIVLASRRPICLGHLVNATPAAGIPRDVPRRPRKRTRGHAPQPRARTGPELSPDWAAVMFRHELDPRPRDEANP